MYFFKVEQIFSDLDIENHLVIYLSISLILSEFDFKLTEHN